MLAKDRKFSLNSFKARKKEERGRMDIEIELKKYAFKFLMHQEILNIVRQG